MNNMDIQWEDLHQDCNSKGILHNFHIELRSCFQGFHLVERFARPMNMLFLVVVVVVVVVDAAAAAAPK